MSTIELSATPSLALCALCGFTSCDLGNIGNFTSNGNGFTGSIRIVPLVREYGVDYPVIVQRIFDP